MIRVNIIGKGFLEMFEEGGMGFKKENQLFRFSDISLGRSSEFSIPDTQNNRLLLELGGDPLQYGTMLRKRYQCQVLYDCGSFMATVAVTAWVPGSFSCVIYMEDSAWLRKIQDLKLADVPWPNDLYCTWDSSTPYDANDPSIPTLAIVKYDNGIGAIAGWQLLPSIDVWDMVGEIKDAIGVPIYGGVGKYRLVFPTINGRDGEDIRIQVTGQNATAFTQIYPYFSTVQFDIEWARANVLGMYVGGGSQSVTGFTVSKDISVTFPTTFPVGVYLLKHNTRLGRCEILGGIDSNGIGDSLAGRTVKLKKGTNYAFVDDDGIGFDSHGSFIGWKDIEYPVDVTVRVIDAHEEMQLGDTWYLADNLPDMTVIEFLRSVALALGREIVFYPDCIIFQTPDKLSFVELEKVISIDTVSRIVEAWGGDSGKATVSFDSEDYVTDPIVAEYPIDNGQLEGVEDHKASFSEGNYSTKGVLIQDVTVENSTPKPTGRKVTITRIDDNLQDLQRVEVPSLAENDDIAQNSTCIKVKLLASESFFFDLAYSDIISFRGMLARWMDAEWSGGVLSLVLQKISQWQGAAENPSPSPTPPVTLVGIDAVFTQGGATIYDTDSLDDLKQYLVVTALYSDSSSAVLSDNDYTLSGTLTVGTSTITASYGGFTDTFSVQVTHIYPYDSLVEYLESDGTQYINLGITPAANEVIKIKFKRVSGTGFAVYIGSRGGVGDRQCYIGQYNGKFVASIGTTNSTALGNYDTNVHIITMNTATGLVSIDGGTGVYCGSFVASSFDICLFALNTNGTIGNNSKIKVMEVEIGTRMSLRPCRKNGVGYMYDAVSDSLLTNNGVFAYGPDI